MAETTAPKPDPINEKDGVGWLFFFLALVAVLVFGFKLILDEFYVGRERSDYGYDILASLFSGWAFVALYYAIYLQRKELRLQRYELKMTREELAKSAEAQFKTAIIWEDQLKIEKRRENEQLRPKFEVEIQK